MLMSAGDNGCCFSGGRSNIGPLYSRNVNPAHFSGLVTIPEWAFDCSGRTGRTAFVPASRKRERGCGPYLDLGF